MQTPCPCRSRAAPRQQRYAPRRHHRAASVRCEDRRYAGRRFLPSGDCRYNPPL